MGRLATLAALSVMSIAIASATGAELDADGQREVAALLAYVGQSHCSFIRNGSTYDAAKAEEHLRYKFNYLMQRDKIHSSEEFIELAGTGSSLSGRPYLVNCDGVERPSADWLREELRHLRASRP